MKDKLKGYLKRISDFLDLGSYGSVHVFIIGLCLKVSCVHYLVGCLTGIRSNQGWLMFLGLIVSLACYLKFSKDFSIDLFADYDSFDDTMF